MKTEIVGYVRRKLKDDFDKCQWTDGVGVKFENSAMKQMMISLDRLEDAMEDAKKLYKEAEDLLSSVKME